ncbi:MAG: four helix bundle protein [Candidatus Hydrogenedentes bacterium]|nr:four helix bundle protein [Candidatus Hydrogenedentota bacterium]
MGLKNYRELDAWQKAMDLVESVYRLTAVFPPHERYGLAGQAQRAAVSIPANIAEGYGRIHRGDYLHHLSISSGSLAELETHLTIAVRLNYVPREDAVETWGHVRETGKLLTKLMQSLDAKQKPSRPKKT